MMTAPNRDIEIQTAARAGVTSSTRISLTGACIVAWLSMTTNSVTVADTIMIPGDAATIQEGIDLAIDGDTVLVDDGIYIENIDFMGKGITVTSVNGPASTTIDGGGNGRVVRILSAEPGASTLDGFTIRNGKGGVLAGGSIVRNNVITENAVTTSEGGGIQAGWSSNSAE